MEAVLKIRQICGKLWLLEFCSCLLLRGDPNKVPTTSQSLQLSLSRPASSAF
jgi:hypothetical protein